MSSRRLALALAGLVAGACTTPSFAKDGEVSMSLTPVDFGEAQAYEGSNYRDIVNSLFASKDPRPQRWARLRPVLDYCGSLRSDANQTFVSVSNEAERKLFSASRPAGEKITLVDMACPWALMAAVFFSIEENKPDAALAYLDRIDALAPYMGWALTERGFVLNALNKRQEALAVYRRAVQVANEHPSSAYAMPIALRGIGWTLVELGDLEAARQAYEEARRVDPGHAGTQAELDYIARLQKEGGPAPSSGVLDLTNAPKSQDALTIRVMKMVAELEVDPFAADAPAKRAALLEWITDSPDVNVLVCNVLGVLGKGKKSPPWGSELLVQSMFGNTAWQLDNPGQKDSSIGQQAAGARSALKAYAAIRLKQPKVSFPSLDALLGHEAPGELEELLAPIVKRECSGTPEKAK